MDVDHLISLLKQVTNELEAMKSQKKEESYVEQNDKLLCLAKDKPFENHILAKKNSVIRQYYMSCLFSVFNETADVKVKNNRQLYMYRIISSYDKNLNIRGIIAKSMELDEHFYEKMSELFEYDLKISFLIDLIVLAMMDSLQSIDKYEIIAHFSEIFNIRNKDLFIISNIAKAIIEQDFDKFATHIDTSVTLDYKNYFSYFDGVKYTAIGSDLSYKTKLMTGVVLIPNITFNNTTVKLNADDSSADMICFKRCKFINSIGIYNQKKKIVFENCVFKGNMPIRPTEENKLKDSYINGYNYVFKDCAFSDFNLDCSLINIFNSEIIGCSFINCKTLKKGTNFILEIRKTLIKNCIFENCTLMTLDSHSGPYEDHYGAMIKSIDSDIQNIDFKKCMYLGDSNGHVCLRLFMIYAKRSSVNQCSFSSCNMKLKLQARGRVYSSETYVIGNDQSMVDNNKFMLCTSLDASAKETQNQQIGSINYVYPEWLF